jgi:septal ring factor EnvC (AmiA/AmiB activator)
VDERFRSLELRMEHFEARVMDRLESIDTRLAGVEAGLARTNARVAGLEAQVASMNTRLDGVTDDMRQRFRVLTEQVAELAA